MENLMWLRKYVIICTTMFYYFSDKSRTNKIPPNMANISLVLIFLNSEGEKSKEKIDNVTKDDTVEKVLESAQKKFNIKDVTTIAARLRSNYYLHGLELGSELFILQMYTTKTLVKLFPSSQICIYIDNIF